MSAPTSLHPIVLPPEVQVKILRHTLSSPTLSTFKGQYAALARYSLVLRAWREWAQAELFKAVFLDTPRCARKLSRVLAKDDKLGSKVEQLWVVLPANPGPEIRTAAGFFLPQLLKACDHLVELWIDSIRDFILPDVAPTKNTLKSLHLTRVTLQFEYDPNSPFPALPNLRHLTMRGLSFGLDPGPFLTPKFFPSLFALSWTVNSVGRQVISPPAALINHVKAFSTRDDVPSMRMVGSVLELHDSSLLLFSGIVMSHWLAPFDVFEIVPKSLRFFFLLVNETVAGAEIEEEDSLVPNLEEIILPREWVRTGGREVRSFSEEIDEMGVRLTIEMEWRARKEGSRFEYEFFKLATWVEKILEKEERARLA